MFFVKPSLMGTAKSQNMYTDRCSGIWAKIFSILIGPPKNKHIKHSLLIMTKNTLLFLTLNSIESIPTQKSLLGTVCNDTWIGGSFQKRPQMVSNKREKTCEFINVKPQRALHYCTSGAYKKSTRYFHKEVYKTSLTDCQLFAPNFLHFFLLKIYAALFGGPQPFKECGSSAQRPCLDLNFFTGLLVICKNLTNCYWALQWKKKCSTYHQFQFQIYKNFTKRLYVK